MSAFPPARGPLAPGDEPDVLDTSSRLDVEERRDARVAVVAKWRARELAEVVFGGDVVAKLSGHGTRAPFRGLMRLSVPFVDLDSHRRHERVFIACARRDDLLARVPLVFVFEAREP